MKSNILTIFLFVCLALPALSQEKAGRLKTHFIIDFGDKRPKYIHVWLWCDNNRKISLPLNGKRQIQFDVSYSKAVSPNVLAIQRYAAIEYSDKPVSAEKWLRPGMDVIEVILEDTVRINKAGEVLGSADQLMYQSIRRKIGDHYRQGRDYFEMRDRPISVKAKDRPFVHSTKIIPSEGEHWLDMQHSWRRLSKLIAAVPNDTLLADLMVYIPPGNFDSRDITQIETRVKRVIGERENFHRILGYMAHFEHPEVIPAFREIELTNIGHKKIQYRFADAPYTLLVFWATWCGPCISTFPAELKALAPWKRKGLRVLYVSIDKDKDRWTKYVPQSLISKEYNFRIDDIERNLFYSTINVQGIPWMCLVDRNGIVKKRRISLYEIDSVFRKAFVN